MIRHIEMTADFYELERRLALALGDEPRPDSMALVCNEATGVLYVDDEEFVSPDTYVIVERSTKALARSYIACLTQS